jgi:8-oxo-dGTP diphosphatase
VKTSTAAIVVREGKVLVLRRSVGTIAGYWEFPGGKVDEGERVQDALAREINEELGVNAEVGSELASTTFANKGQRYELRAFETSISDTSFQLRDHDAFDWLEPAALRRIDLAESDRKLLSTIEGVFRRRGEGDG